jgi:hypothetical protein
VTSFAQRYRAGEHRAVWEELRALGPVPQRLQPDVAATAAETMRRAAVHIARIAEALPDLGFVPAFGAPYIPADATCGAEVGALSTEIGGLPAALAAAMREIGSVSFIGDCPALDLHYHDVDGEDSPVLPDPLDLPSVKNLRYEWRQYQNGYRTDDGDPDWPEEAFKYAIAPDDLHKANVSGGAQLVLLPDTLADPFVHGLTYSGVDTLVEYLRLSIAWGGFPGWSNAPELAPAALAGLRTTPAF